MYRLACHELCVQPDEALLAALEGQVGWEEGFEGEEGAVTVTMRGLVRSDHWCVADCNWLDRVVFCVGGLWALVIPAPLHRLHTQHNRTNLTFARWP